MSPADSPARDQAVANLAAHGPLGAALADIKAAQQSLAETLALVADLQTGLVAALARQEAVRALLPDADHTARCLVWGTVSVLGGDPDKCDCVLAAIRAALDPTEGAP